MRDHLRSVAEKRNSDVLRSLPRTRPHRRSEKRGVRVGEPGSGTVTQSPPAARPQNGATRAKRAEATAKRAEATDLSSTRRAPEKPKPAQPKAGAPKAKPVPRTAGTRKPKPTTLRQPAQPAGAPPGQRGKPPAEPSRPDVLGTAVQAAAELAEIGLSVGARAIRGAVSRLPKP